MQRRPSCKLQVGRLPLRPVLPLCSGVHAACCVLALPFTHSRLVCSALLCCALSCLAAGRPHRGHHCRGCSKRAAAHCESGASATHRQLLRSHGRGTPHLHLHIHTCISLKALP
jgi:hypothetical protein